MHDSDTTRSTLQDGGVSPGPANGERARHWEPSRLISGVIDRRERVGARFQDDGIRFPVGIGLIDGINQAGHIPGCTRKVGCLAGAC